LARDPGERDASEAIRQKTVVIKSGRRQSISGFPKRATPEVASTAPEVTGASEMRAGAEKRQTLDLDSVLMNTNGVAITPKAIQDLLDELEASRASRKRAWEVLQELRWVLKDITGVEVPAPEKKTIDFEGRILKEAIRKALRERQGAIAELVQAIKEYRKLADQPLTLRDSVFGEVVQKLKHATEKADRLLGS
jgi:hypothetical protein